MQIKLRNCNENWLQFISSYCILLSFTIRHIDDDYHETKTKKTARKQKKIYCIEMCCIFFFDWANCGR